MVRHRARPLVLLSALLALPAPAARAAGTAEVLAAILARPLFTPGRRPPAAAVRASGSPRLAGTIVGPGGVRVAILAWPGRDRPLALREGDSGAGLSVIAVSPGRVLAALARDRIVLTLHGTSPADPPPAAALPPAPEMTKDPRSRDPNNQDE